MGADKVLRTQLKRCASLSSVEGAIKPSECRKHIRSCNEIDQKGDSSFRITTDDGFDKTVGSRKACFSQIYTQASLGKQGIEVSEGEEKCTFKRKGKIHTGFGEVCEEIAAIEDEIESTPDTVGRTEGGSGYQRCISEDMSDQRRSCQRRNQNVPSSRKGNRLLWKGSASCSADRRAAERRCSHLEPKTIRQDNTGEKSALEERRDALIKKLPSKKLKTTKKKRRRKRRAEFAPMTPPTHALARLYEGIKTALFG